MFTDGGVEQLDFDLKHYLMPLIAGHCDAIISRQLFEKWVRGHAVAWLGARVIACGAVSVYSCHVKGSRCFSPAWLGAQVIACGVCIQVT